MSSHLPALDNSCSCVCACVSVCVSMCVCVCSNFLLDRIKHRALYMDTHMPLRSYVVVTQATKTHFISDVSIVLRVLL